MVPPFGPTSSSSGRVRSLRPGGGPKGGLVARLAGEHYLGLLVIRERHVSGLGNTRER